MKITSLFKNLNNIKNNSEFKIGNKYSFNIKEIINKNTAKISINGKEIKAEFQNNIDENNVNSNKLEIISIDENKIKAKIIDDCKIDNNTKILKKLGIKETKELNKVVKILNQEGIRVNKDNIKELDKYFKNHNITFDKKIKVLKKLIEKDIDITYNNLKSISEALMGKGINQSLLDIYNFENKENNTKNNFHVLKKILSNEQLNTTEINNLIKNIDKEHMNNIIKNIKKTHDSNLELDIIDKIESDLTNAIDVYYNSENVSDLTYMDNLIGINDMSTKRVVMSKVTEDMKIVKSDFKEFKSNILRNIDSILFEKHNIQTNVKSLEDTINMIDRKILNSDITLYTDMLTEKKLINLSSKLNIAREYLKKSQPNKANEIVSEIKETISTIKFNPSQEKMMYRINKEVVNSKENSFKDINFINIFKNSNLNSSRDIYNYVRKLGINYERELLNDGLYNLNKNDIDKNLKIDLIKILQEKGVNKSKDVTKIIKALDNLNGQQLMNKNDKNSMQQNMFFDIPFDLLGKVQNMKLFINSKKENEKMDWKNSSLYFLIETNKLGETGILLDSNNRNLNITIKNNNKDFQNKVNPFKDSLITKLEEIGYNVNNINYDILEEVDNKKEDNIITDDNYVINGEGLDIKI